MLSERKYADLISKMNEIIDETGYDATGGGYVEENGEEFFSGWSLSDYDVDVVDISVDEEGDHVVLTLWYPGQDEEEYIIKSLEDLDNVPLPIKGSDPVTFFDMVEAREAELSQSVKTIGRWHDDPEKDTSFCRWYGNPLPVLPTIEETWDGESVLFCTEEQFAVYEELGDYDMIIDTNEPCCDAGYEYHYWITKAEISAVEVFKAK